MITLNIDTNVRERNRGAQWKLAQINERRAAQVPPLDPLSMTEFLEDQVGRLADMWADQQLAEESLPALKDAFLTSSPSRRQAIIDLINSPES